MHPKADKHKKHTVENNYISPSSTVGIRLHWVQLHVSALYVCQHIEHSYVCNVTLNAGHLMLYTGHLVLDTGYLEFYTGH